MKLEKFNFYLIKSFTCCWVCIISISRSGWTFKIFVFCFGFFRFVLASNWKKYICEMRVYQFQLFMLLSQNKISGLLLEMFQNKCVIGCGFVNTVIYQNILINRGWVCFEWADYKLFEGQLELMYNIFLFGNW